MTPIKSTLLPEILEGKWLRHYRERDILFLSTDSRKAVFNPSCLFFAITGSIHNGHKYVDELYGKNIRQFIIEDPEFTIDPYPEANFFHCENTVRALQLLSAWRRKQYNLHVTGITGSNGKTIVKEWLSQLLSWKQNVVKTPKSFNSQIGVPLSIWQIQDYHEIGIFEAGISQRGEMNNLRKIIMPDTGIFTNIGPAHDEGFHSWEDKIHEKLILFENADHLIYNRDNELLHNTINDKLKDISKISWGKDPEAYYQTRTTIQSTEETLVNITRKKTRFNFIVPFSDKASLENIQHCIVFLLHSGWTEKQIQEGLSEISKISMRLVMKKGINDCYIIDDSYNNDLAGLEIALHYLNNQNQRNKKTLIITDILQSGMTDSVLNRHTAELLDHYPLHKIIAIGKQIEGIRVFLKNRAVNYYSGTEAFLNQHKINSFRDEVILIKGARKFGLEKIVSKLQEKIHGTVLEINLDAISHNLNVYRSFLNPGTKIMVMVKALAYGSGSIEIANLLQFHRVDYLGVAYTDEGVTLRKNGISLPVMIMNPSIDAFEKITDFRLEPEIYNLKLLKEIDNWTKNHKRSVKIHLKFDTGMHRLGFPETEADEVLNLIKKNPLLQPVSIFSHLAGADDPLHDAYTQQQAGGFLNIIEKFKNKSGQIFIRHLANSAAIVRFPEYQFDMVRLGIGLYGTDATGIISHQLKPIGTLKTTISQIITLDETDSVGYSRKGRINRKSRIATIAIGYADGFSRSFSNGNGTVFVNGHLAPVVGNVCMDMTMVDITGIQAEEGDAVIIFGEPIPLHHLARAINTIPYEILTSVSERVKRIYISE